MGWKRIIRKQPEPETSALHELDETITSDSEPLLRRSLSSTFTERKKLVGSIHGGVKEDDDPEDKKMGVRKSRFWLSGRIYPAVSPSYALVGTCALIGGHGILRIGLTLVCFFLWLVIAKWLDYLGDSLHQSMGRACIRRFLQRLEREMELTQNGGNLRRREEVIAFRVGRFNARQIYKKVLIESDRRQRQQQIR